MIDSETALNLINKEIIKKYNIPTQSCTPPINIKTICNVGVMTPELWIQMLALLKRVWSNKQSKSPANNNIQE